jgi:hypothetical protein
MRASLHALAAHQGIFMFRQLTVSSVRFAAHCLTSI